MQCVSSLGECLQNCQFAPAAGSCPGGSTCTNYTDHPTIGGVEWGVCL